MSDDENSTMLQTLSDRLSKHQVFGDPVQQGDTTLVPVAQIRVGGGRGRNKFAGAGGGVGVVARPAGAFALADGNVAWHPAVSVNRIILGAQIAVASIAISFAITSVVRRKS